MEIFDGVIIKQDDFHSPDCSGILFLNRLCKKSIGEKDTAESRKQLLKINDELL